ncbi:MAG: acetyl-CoA carboxylase biotin carboxylase subunit [Acidobacteria bacterium]|nr:acetyl-CoA carboxylase biotin carboxylase subunit [Acidobacteriota bacterium]
MFNKILIANRGEIAVRLIRACRDLNISPVAVYSEADRESLHVKMADEAYVIGPAASSESYLSIERILDAALKSKAEAIHPGYGFLAENAQFAKACEDVGLVFIGPSAGAMKLMGDKIASRLTVEKAGVPTIPGKNQPVDSVREALALASDIGYPVMIKASAGGGGKGLRRVSNEEELRSVYEMTRGEAQSSFGNATIYLEKAIDKPRHIEVQLMGDHDGNLIHLGERECSIQRRHQKIVEECPSPVVDAHFRERIGDAAKAAAAAIGYYSLGTVEFLVDSTHHFYFLEMNTRLQVEHPITELVTGIDLVREQIHIAAGERLRFRQQDIRFRGAAIECRIYAEDPRNNFFPSPGKITSLFEPSGPGIRNDSGVYPGFTITVHYDPLISKLVAYGENRPQAVDRMRRALGEYKIGGIQTTIPFLELLLSHPAFSRGELHTQFIEEHGLLDRLNEDGSLECSVPVIAAALSYFLDRRKTPAVSPAPRGGNWREFGRFPRHPRW